MALRNPRWLFIGVNRNTIAFVHPIWMVQYSRRTLLIPNLDTRCGQRLRALRQLSDCPEGAPSAKTLSSPTFTVSPSLLRAAAIGKCQARVLAQVSLKKKPEG